MMIAMKLPLVICLLSGLSRVSAQYDPGPYRVGVPVKLGPPGNFVTAFQFEDFLSSAPPKQYVATVLTNNEAISISPPSHALPDAHAQQNSLASPGKHREDYQAILNKQPQPQGQYVRQLPAYAAHVPQENGREHPPPAQFPQSVEKPRHGAHMHDAVSNDGTIQLPKERLSVSSFSSMQAAKDTFGEQIKLDPKNFQKELDNVEWREEIVFPRPGPPRIKWNPKTYTEDERIVKARNNRYVYAEFRDGPEPDDALEQTGRKIPPKVKPSLNSRITHATTQYDPTRHRPLKTHVPTLPERGNSHGKVIYEQQPFRVKEEEHLRSQFGYVSKPQPDHEVRYYPQKDARGTEEPSSEVDYDRAFGLEPQVRPHRDSQSQTSSGPQISEEDPRNPYSEKVEYRQSAYEAPKNKIVKYQKGDEDSAAIQQAGFEDEDALDLPRSRDAHAYRQGRQNRHHRYRDEEPQHDDRSVYNRKVPKYVSQDSTGKALRGDLEEYSRKSAQTHSAQREKIQQHRHEYRPDLESEEIPVTHGHSYRARSEVPRHVTANSKYTSEYPRKHTSARNVGGTTRYKRKKKPVYYDDDDDEGEHEEAQPRRFNIRFENNPGEPFSFRKDNRKGESAEEIDDTDDDHDDRVGLSSRYRSRSIRLGSEVGEGGVNLSFKLA